MFHMEARTFDVSTQTWFNPTGMISNARPIQILPREEITKT